VPRRRPGHGVAGDDAVAAIYDRLAATITPRSDLVYDSAFQLLVAVVLSAQATDASVNRATPALFAAAPDAAALARLGAAGIEPFIRRIGLYRTKARHLAALGAALIAQHAGTVPRDRAALEALPGVGRKTANVVLNIVWGEGVIAVDTHVHRVANRMGFASTTTPERTEAALMERTPASHLRHAHHYLILHGRYCCTARAPRCADCPVATWCPRIGVA
jgi:endonuclease III